MLPQFLDIDTVNRQRAGSGKPYFEFLRVPAMSTGLYFVPRGGKDPQGPHREDELYYVVNGKARMTAGNEVRTVGAGSIIFVPANVEHRFHEIEEDLIVLVVFSPAETV